jgi:hypothetical protein
VINTLEATSVDLKSAAERIIANVEKVIIGKNAEVKLTLVACCARAIC